MLVGRVIDHQINQHAHAALACAVRELDEVPERAEARIDVVVVTDVVAVIQTWRGLEWHQPYRGDAQSVKIVEPACETFEVTDAVAVAVHEGTHGQAVDDRILVPEVVDHAAFIQALGKHHAAGALTGQHEPR